MERIDFVWVQAPVRWPANEGQQLVLVVMLSVSCGLDGRDIHRVLDVTKAENLSCAVPPT
ncbi:MAG: hypothetical protein P8Q26_07960 [Ascidiaceihabitans sp.]|nr:hypothetical protein [Ascidiaceihabitans sp.]